VYVGPKPKVKPKANDSNTTEEEIVIPEVLPNFIQTQTGGKKDGAFQAQLTDEQKAELIAFGAPDYYDDEEIPDIGYDPAG